MLWYKQKIEIIFDTLKSSESGLSSTEASHRLKLHGQNIISAHKESFWKILIEPFSSVFVMILIFASMVSLLKGEYIDSIIVGAIIAINSIIFYSQKLTTNKVLKNLSRHTISTVNTLRDQRISKILSTELVPGDVIELAEGDKVPADCRIIHQNLLAVNESSLTGESKPVYKNNVVLQKTHPIYEHENMLYQGTFVLSGATKAVVVQTGKNTEFGKIAKLSEDSQQKSPVQQKIDELIKQLVKAIIIASSLVFLLSLIRGIPISESLRFVLSLSVAAVPEGLPIALTVIIVLGMRRMAKHQALVRSFKAIEDVGQITVIATDKTGTITKNILKVVDSWSIDKKDVNSVAPLTLNPEGVTDPLDKAIAELSSKKHQISHFYPFDLSLRMSGTYLAEDKMIYVKGAPEHLINVSNISAKDRKNAESQIHKMTSKGYRVIAVAIKQATTAPDSLKGISGLELVGLIALADELRSEAKPAINLAHQAGIKVSLITGDHYETAYNIAKTVGIANHPNDVVQGHDLPKNDQKLATLASKIKVYSRIVPEDKYRIVRALNKTEITAMTGDGVNDVPALTNATVGFSMGSGSDIAKDAGDIILLNDNFATIIKAIAEGRRIYNNIRKMLFYLLSTSLGEVLTMIGALILGLPLPVTAIQILWINLVTDTALVLPLGLEPAEEDVMKQPPRSPKDKLLSRDLVSRMLLMSSTMAVVVLTLVFVLHQRGYSEAYIQTVAFTILIVAQWANVLNARSEYGSSLVRLKVLNKPLIAGFAVAINMQAVVLLTSFGEFLDVVAVDAKHLIIPGIFMAIVIVLNSEIHKRFSRRLILAQ